MTHHIVLMLVYVSEMDEDRGDVRVALPEGLLVDFERLPQVRFGLRELALLQTHERELVFALPVLHVARAEHLPALRETVIEYANTETFSLIPRVHT
jgi:hypothetical protein